jgi:outer membrane protein TolC
MKMGSVAVVLLSSLLAVSIGRSQGMNATSATNQYAGSVTNVTATPEVKQLSMDEAIRMGLENNLALTLARDNQKQANAQKLNSLQALLPTITGEAQTGVHQYNLAAQGFSPAVAGQFGKLLGIGGTGNFSLITKADVTIVQANYQQSVFNWSAIDNYRAARSNETAAFYSAQSSRGLVVLNVGTTYLQALAASAQVDYAQALLKTDEVLLHQAVEEHAAGTAANLDELRARVTYQTQQQSLISAENTFEKAKIALNREIGLPAEQKIALSDAAPYADLAAMSIEDARQMAYASRQDYQGMKAQIRTAELHRNAARHERLPSLTFGGNYGVTGVSGQVYHGTFAAVGTLQLPLFHEAQFRGDRDVAEAQLSGLISQMADLRSRIDGQLRDSLLDVQAAQDLVQVARSNVDLSITALQQTTDRFQAGVDDNLPVVQAQSTLANAQTQLVNSLFRFNQAKLQFARNLGIVDTQYQKYLLGGTPQVRTASPQGGR